MVMIGVVGTSVVAIRVVGTSAVAHKVVRCYSGGQGGVSFCGG